jgi:hypothetical protein
MNTEKRLTLTTRPLGPSLKDRLLADGFKEGPKGVLVKVEGDERKEIEFMDSGIKVTLDLVCGIRLLGDEEVDKFFDTDLGEIYGEK